MSFRNFFLGLSASFGVAWLAIIIVPFMKMRSIEPILNPEEDGTNTVYIPKRAGRVADGAQIYAENGCYQCHTQLVRPTYAGNDMFRPDWGGLAADEDRGDTRRETNSFDFNGEKFAQIGVARFGPDLSNLGRRVESIYAPRDHTDPETWLYRHLYSPRWKPDRRKSGCPSFKFLFAETESRGIDSDESLAYLGTGDLEISPKPAAKALVSYLLSLRKDQLVPAALNFSPKGSENGKPPAAASAK